MTVSSSQSKVSYAGDGATTVFPVPFAFVLNADVVAVKAAADGTETPWVENTHYTLAGAGDPAGGTLSVLTAPDDHTPASGETLTIRRVVALTQETDYPEGGEFPAQAHERALDKLTHAVQQLDEAQGRALSLPVTSPVSGAAVPAPEAQKYLRWNAAADGLENASLPEGAVALSDTEPAALDGTGAAGASGDVSRADHRHPDATASRGDLLVRGAAGTTRLPVGAVRRPLISDGTDPAWGGGLDADAEFALSGTLTPPQITADQDDYTPAGLSAASTLRLATDGARSLSGLAGGFDGRVIVVHNVGASPLVLAHEGAGSTAANRFLLGADLALGADRSAVLRYDGASERWRMVASPSVGPVIRKVIHEADTSLASIGSGGTKIGNTLEAVPIPLSGIIRLTVVELAVNETSGMGNAQFAATLSVGGVKVWPSTNGNDGTFYEDAYVVEAGVTGRRVRFGLGNASQTPFQSAFDISELGYPAGLQNLEIHLADKANGSIGEVTVAGSAHPARFLVEVLAYE